MDLHPATIDALLAGELGAPSTLLGRHVLADAVSIRCFLPWAQAVSVVQTDSAIRVNMQRHHEDGLFVVHLGPEWAQAPYHFELELENGETQTMGDAYAFPPQLSDYDRYLFARGEHREIYDKLGAHLCEVNGVAGVHFAVWAPNGYKVALLGDFNRWDARVHPMHNVKQAGIWELFVPGIGEGTTYKLEVRSHNRGYRGIKADPYARFAELRPQTASIVTDLERYSWGDADWMQARTQGNPLQAPINIYELHLGSWRRNAEGEFLHYRELAQLLPDYLQDMGYTHLQLLPVMEHPLDASWGYQVTGYYAPTSRFGPPQDFMLLVDRCHQAGIGVILDWVPAHFPKDGFGLNYFDGTHLYSHEDPRQGEHPDWGTMIFNYGRSEVRNFLLANALFWLKKYHIDGLRVDAVSSMIYLNYSREDGEWIPNRYGSYENLEALDFLREFNTLVHAEVPGAFTVAEEATSYPMVSRPTYTGGLGFTFKWNMGWMHDTLAYMKHDPVHRRYHHHDITFASMYAYSENFVLPLSHDEVVHMKGSLIGRMPGDYWQKFANLRLLFGYQTAQSGKKLTFMGGEFAQFAEWSEARSLDWHLLDYDKHARMQRWLQDLNHLYRTQPALWQCDCEPRGFRWIEANDAENSVYSFLRFAEDSDDFLLIVMNGTPVPRESYRMGVPRGGYYREMLNSDADCYGGSNVGNGGGLHSEDSPSHGLPHSLRLRLPPLAILFLQPQPAPG